MAARLDPVTGAARERMVEATAVAAQFLLDLVEAVAPGASDNPHTFLDARLDQALLAAGRTYLGQVADRYRAGTPVNDQQAALMTVLLDLPSVRDVAAWRTTGEPWEIDMWTDLVRRAEPEFTATPAVLLTLSALRAGNGALAAMAVQRALQADPADSLAQTLAEVVAAGMDPATVAALLSG